MSAHVGPAVLIVIDPNQCGGIPKSSTLLALTSMLHHWSKASDGTGVAIRIVRFDYRRAFDLIDHNLLIQKILNVDIPGGDSNWVTLNYHRLPIQVWAGPSQRTLGNQSQALTIHTHD